MLLMSFYEALFSKELQIFDCISANQDNSLGNDCRAACLNMMTSSNGSIFRVTGHLCGEFTGHRWIPRTKASDVFFDLRLNERLSKQSWGWWFETPSRPLWRHSNAYATYMPLGLQFTNVRSMARCVQNPSRAFKSIISMSMSVLRNHQGQFCVSCTSLTCLNQYTIWLIEINCSCIIDKCVHLQLFILAFMT